jgi:hypothetical protein
MLKSRRSRSAIDRHIEYGLCVERLEDHAVTLGQLDELSYFFFWLVRVEIK